jgi:hypothetical protein
MEIRLPKASESGGSIFLAVGRVRELFDVAGNFELMRCYLLESDGDAPEQRNEEDDDADIDEDKQDSYVACIHGFSVSTSNIVARQE